MPLIYSGRTAPHTNGDLSIQATDAASGKSVSVRASLDAIQDCGLAQVKQVASKKYDQGALEADGGVFVRSADCR